MSRDAGTRMEPGASVSGQRCLPPTPLSAFRQARLADGRCPGTLPAERGAYLHESIVRRLSGLDGSDLLAPLIDHDFRGRIALVSSFGAESAVLLHMVARIDRSVPVIFLDTGKHFPETIAHRSKLVDRLGLTDIRIVQPDADSVRLLDADGSLAVRDLSAPSAVYNTFNLQRHLISRRTLRVFRDNAMEQWRAAVAA